MSDMTERLLVGLSGNQIDHLIEIRGVYDGWSIAVHRDGSLHNRWAQSDGTAIPGYERRWQATEDAIAAMWAEREAVES